MREIRIGEDVLTPDGERLGTVERLVVDPGAHRITHVVVGDRMLSLGRLTDGGSDGLTADVDHQEFGKLPEVNPEQVRPAGEGWLAPAGHTLQHFLSVAEAIVGQGPYVPPVHADLDVSNVHEITPSSPVWSGKERLGHVAEVTTDDSGALIDFVLDPGLLRHRVRVPAGRVIEVVGNNVHVDLTEDELEDLPAEDVKGWISTVSSQPGGGSGAAPRGRIHAPIRVFGYPEAAVPRAPLTRRPKIGGEERLLSVTPQLAAMIAFMIVGVIFFVTVWVVVLRAHRKDEPPRR